MYHLYILRCADASLYVGITRNLRARVSAHQTGCGAAYTARRRTLVLVHHETVPDLTAAVRRERQIKRWTRRRKLSFRATSPI